MTEKLFSRYLQLNRYQVVAAQLYKNKVINRSELTAIKERIADLEIELIMPKQKTSRHPRKLTVIK